MKWLLALLGALLIVIGIGAYVLMGLQQIHIERFTVDSIKDFGQDSFTITGTLFVENPSLLDVQVTGINYDLVLNATQETISTGTIDGFVLPAGITTQVPFTQEINWKPTLSMARDLLTKDKVLLVVDGSAHLDIKGYQTSSPIHAAMDIKPLLKNWISEQTGGISDLLF